MSSIRSSKNSSSFLTGVATPIDIGTTPFIGKIERADVYSSISTVIDLLPAALQPGVTGGVVKAPISAGGTGYSGGATGTLVGETSGAVTATYTVSGHNSGVVTSVTVSNPGSGYVPGETLALNPNSGGGSGAKATMISELDGKAIELQIFESPCDPTDLNQFPNEPGAVAGGGLAPTQTQLDRYFNQQFDTAPKLTYFDQTPRTSQCLGITAVTQSYVVIKATATTSGMPLQCRVESYLYKDALPLVTTNAGGAAPSTPASESTLSAVRDAVESVSKCANTANDHLRVEIANDTLSSSSPLHVQLKANSNASGSGTNYHVTSDSGGRLYVTSDTGLPMNALTDAGASQSLRCDSGSLRVNVTATTVTNLGTQGSLANGESFSSGNTSTAVDVSALNHGNLLYSDTSGVSTIAVEVSGNGSAYYKAKDMAVDTTERQAVLSLDLRGLSHIRLKAGGSFTNVVASIYGTA